MDSRRQRHDSRSSRILPYRRIGARLFSGLVSRRRRHVSLRRHVSRRRLADVFARSGVARRRDFAALLADEPVSDQESRVFADVAVLFADFAVLFADFSHLFADFAVLFADVA